MHARKEFLFVSHVCLKVSYCTDRRVQHVRYKLDLPPFSVCESTYVNVLFSYIA